MTDAPLPGGDAIPLAIPGGHGHVLGSGDTVTDAWLAIIEKINAKLGATHPRPPAGDGPAR